MPATLPHQYAFLVGETELLMEDETVSEEIGYGSRLAKHEYARVNGVEAEEMGDTPRSIKIGWRLKAASESLLRSGMDAVQALRGQLGTLTVRGATPPWYNVVMDGPPRFFGRTPPQADGSVSVRCEQVFTELDPTPPPA